MRQTGSLQVVEHTVIPRSSTTACADQLILGTHTVGVVDGTTAKSWDDPAGPDGAFLAKAVAAALAELPFDVVMADAVELATEVVAGAVRNCSGAAGGGPAVTLCVVHAARREVWRVGEARVLVDGTPWPPTDSGERVIAAARALVLRDRLTAGISRDCLMEQDPGREAIRELLRSLVNLRNVAEPHFGYGSIDGTPVPYQFLETLPLPSNPCEVVLATDGYPQVGHTLAATERLLAARLDRDPLMIEDPAETKGLRPGANSFDDRAYVRVVLPGTLR